MQNNNSGHEGRRNTDGLERSGGRARESGYSVKNLGASNDGRMVGLGSRTQASDTTNLIWSLVS